MVSSLPCGFWVLLGPCREDQTEPEPLSLAEAEPFLSDSVSGGPFQFFFLSKNFIFSLLAEMD